MNGQRHQVPRATTAELRLDAVRRAQFSSCGVDRWLWPPLARGKADLPLLKRCKRGILIPIRQKNLVNVGSSEHVWSP
jgi:hypothetical protein